MAGGREADADGPKVADEIQPAEKTPREKKWATAGSLKCKSLQHVRQGLLMTVLVPGGEWRHLRRDSEDVTQERRFAVKVGSDGDGKGQQTGGCEGTRSCDREKPRPPFDKGCNACCTLRRGSASRACPCEPSDERGCFCTPATPNLEAKDHNSALMGTSDLRVSAFLGPAGLSQGSACSGATTATGHTGRSAWRHQHRANSKMGATPQRQTIGDDLDATLGKSGGIEVQVSEKDVGCNCSASLTANPSRCAFERTASRPKNTRPRAGSDMVTCLLAS
eukprot:s4198_g6.t1